MLRGWGLYVWRDWFSSLGFSTLKPLANGSLWPAEDKG